MAHRRGWSGRRPGGAENHCEGGDDLRLPGDAAGLAVADRLLARRVAIG